MTESEQRIRMAVKRAGLAAIRAPFGSKAEADAQESFRIAVGQLRALFKVKRKEA